jgi:spoIIIJ-associated protein
MAQENEPVRGPEEHAAPVPPPAEPIDQQELVRQTVQKLVAYIGVRGRVEVTYERDGYVADVISRRPATVLIGRQGDTLEAIGLIAHLIAVRHYPQCPLVTIDVGGYRRRHEQYLRGKAQAIATIVTNTGREMAVEFLSEPEFQIVKDELHSNRTLRVHAVGDGERRNVIISPVKR